MIEPIKLESTKLRKDQDTEHCFAVIISDLDRIAMKINELIHDHNKKWTPNA